jgi:dephospho-CoA kinase
MVFVLGMTGSIGMGKSATAAMFRRLGVPLHDADACVHGLYAPGGGGTEAIALAFPGSLAPDGGVDRAALGRMVLGQPERLAELEGLVHPLVRKGEERFLARAAAARAPLAVLDIPLLFETGADERCDAVAVVSASPEVQRARVLARPGMDPDKFAHILGKQMPDPDKRRRAHFLVDTGRGFAAAERQVRDIIRALAGRPGGPAG